MKTKTIHCESSNIQSNIMGIEFLLDNPPYCAHAKDRIASVSLDVGEATEVFLMAGYSLDQISEIYIDSSYLRHMENLNLPKSVEVEFLIGVK